jgi:hypothetical protein
VPGTAILGIVLGTTVGAIVNAATLAFSLGRRFPGILSSVLFGATQIFAASVIGGFTTYLALNVLAPVLPTQTLIGIFLQGFLAGIVGLIIFVLILFALKNSEIKEVWSAFHRQIFRAKAIIPEQESL